MWAKKMAAMIVSAVNRFVDAISDDKFEQNIREAIAASNDDYAFRIQLEETLRFSNFTIANEEQQANTAFSSPLSNPFSSKDEASSSFSKEEEEYMSVNYYEQDYGFEFRGNGGEKRGSSSGKEVDSGLEWWQCSNRVQKPVPLELCGICYEDSKAEMFEGMSCLHRFCQSCLTKYINLRLEQKRHQIYCPHESCREVLIPQECHYFLPAEIIEAWSAVVLEAEIPESQKVYCPFPNCSAMLLKEVADLSAEEILNAECPFCNRMFCVRCMVPWHADIDCEEFQKLPAGERSEEDRQLLKLAENRKWQRCGKCKSVIELEYGCNHMTCRCGNEFCYECGAGWTSGRRSCDCPRTNENRLLHQTR